MTQNLYEINPVKAVTADAVGEPGHRVFYIQARSLEATITLLAEKAQVVMLAQGIYQLLAEIEDRYAMGSEPTLVDPQDLDLHFPLEPDFRMGQIELAYDSSTDLVVLSAYELMPEEPEAQAHSAPEAPSVARLHATRAQVLALAHRGMEVAARGRPACPLCGQPDDAQGHICPRRNGHPSPASTS